MPFYPRTKKFSIVRSGPVAGTYRIGNREKWLQNDGLRFELAWMAGARGKPGVNGDVIDASSTVRSITDREFEINGDNGGSSDDVTYNPEGGLVFTTDSAADKDVILLPHLDANLSPWERNTWGSDQETHWECLIKTGASVASTVIWAGLKLTTTNVTITDAHQAFLRYEDTVNGGIWQAVSSVTGDDDEHNTKKAVAVSTAYHLAIEIDSTRRARFYINGDLVETSAPLVVVDLKPYIGVKGNAKVLNVRGQAISRLYA